MFDSLSSLSDFNKIAGVELIIIRHHYFKTSFALLCLQGIVSGALVFAAGVIIGQS